jgi:hypothetical protein
MPKTTLYTLNGSAGAFTSILSTIPARRVELREDESVAAQGLQYQKPEDNFTATFVCGTPAGPDQPQIVLGNVVAHAHGRGNLLGLPAQNTGGVTIPATTYIKVKSKTVTGTTLRVTEME